MQAVVCIIDFYSGMIQWVSEIQISMVFRNSIAVWFPNSSDFRHCLKFETKFQFSDTFFSRCVCNLNFGLEFRHFSEIFEIWNQSSVLRHIVVSEIQTRNKFRFQEFVFQTFTVFNIFVWHQQRNCYFYQGQKKLVSVNSLVMIRIFQNA